MHRNVYQILNRFWRDVYGTTSKAWPIKNDRNRYIRRSIRVNKHAKKQKHSNTSSFFGVVWKFKSESIAYQLPCNLTYLNLIILETRFKLGFLLLKNRQISLWIFIKAHSYKLKKYIKICLSDELSEVMKYNEDMWVGTHSWNERSIFVSFNVGYNNDYLCISFSR